MEPPGGDEAAADATGIRLVTRARKLDDVPIRSLLRSTERPRFAWADADETIATLGAAASISARGGDRFRAVRRRADALLADADVPSSLPDLARPRCVGGFTFHASDEAAEACQPWTGFPDAYFAVPEAQLVCGGDETWLTVTVPTSAAQPAASRLDEWADWLARASSLSIQTPPGVTGRSRTPSRDGWREQVSAALQRVNRGTLEKVVLAQALTVELAAPMASTDVYARLGDCYPECHRFMISPGTGPTFLGATPERLVSQRGRTIATEALAGSTARGQSPAEDQSLASALLDSEKDTHEHELVVDAIETQLEHVASSITRGRRSVRKLPSVQHLRTPIEAELDRDEHVLSLVEALHPTPAVGGLPPDSALQTIRESETFDRGWYAAPIGWFDADGDGTFAVAIRSAVMDGQTASLFAGAGIVADSDPDREWDEVQLKYRPILDALE
jgi:menaquinone-specific isochorismate synthase